jgi:predicted ATPase
LLAGCSKLKVMVTSRGGLHVRAEHEFPVPPLSLPNLKRLPNLSALTQYEAVALFIERALATRPDFQVTNANAPAVAAVCARLDGLPLAIELAAARVKHFSPQTLLSRLEQGLSILSGGARDLPGRQQTLRGAIAWSYELLSPEEQYLFRRLAVFVDGWDWRAAEEVCMAAGKLEGDVLEGLASLVDKSLLRQEEQAEGETRFWMLQTLREFGLERLTGTGELEVTRLAHAQYFLRLAEEAAPYLRETRQVRWFDRLEQEHENVRAALSWLLERAMKAEEKGKQQAEQALRMCAALHWFWCIRGYFREGQYFLEQALAVRQGVAPTIQARTLLSAGELAFFLDDYQRVETLAGESLALYRELADANGIAVALDMLGNIAWARGDYGVARSMLEEAEASFKVAGDIWKRCRCLTQLARILAVQSEYQQAHSLLEESLELYRTLDDRERIGWVLYLLAQVLFASKGDLERSYNLTEQSLTLLKEIGFKPAMAYGLSLLGQLHLERGDLSVARQKIEESVALFREIGDRGGTAEAQIGLARVLRFQDDFPAAGHLYQESLTLLQEIHDKEFIPSCLEGLAAVKAEVGELVWATRLWGIAEAWREAIGTPIPPVYRTEYQRVVDAVRTQLDEETFAASWAEGRSMKLERVLTNETS